MADIINPYANPYLPSFVNQRPRINDNRSPMTTPVFGTSYSQIHPVSGFDGARNYAANLANGSSEIVPESDPEIARVYIVAKDQNGQVLMQPFRLIPEEEPKPVTMDDLNSKMSELLERMNKLEEERANGKPGNESSGNAKRNTNDARSQSNVRNGSSVSQSASDDTTNVTK